MSKNSNWNCNYFYDLCLWLMNFVIKNFLEYETILFSFMDRNVDKLLLSIMNNIQILLNCQSSMLHV